MKWRLKSTRHAAANTFFYLNTKLSQNVLDLLQPEVEAAIFALQPGELDPEPVKSSLGYHVVQTLERVKDRPLSQAALAQKRQRAFIAWLENQRALAVIERYVGSQSQ